MQLIYGIIWSEFSWENQGLVEKQEHEWLVNWKEWQNSNYHFNWNIAKLYFIYCYMHYSRSAPAFETALKIHLFKSAYFWSTSPCVLWLIHKRKLCPQSLVVCVCVCLCLHAWVCVGGWGGRGCWVMYTPTPGLAFWHHSSKLCHWFCHWRGTPDRWTSVYRKHPYGSQSAPSVKFAKGLSTKTVEATHC